MRALLIEDADEDYLIVQRMLRESAHPSLQLARTATLAEGLRHLALQPADVVLLDFALPDSEGWDGFHRLRAQVPHVPIIFLTGLENETLGVLAVQEGAQDYLVKGSLQAPQLIRAVRYAVERQRIEERLRESEERFRSLVEVTSDWVWECDAAGVLTYASPKVVEIVGRTPAEVVGQALAATMLPAHGARFQEDLDAAAAARRPLVRVESAVPRPDGQVAVIETSGVPMVDRCGVLRGYRGIIRDITEPKQAEEALELYRERLEHLVHERTTELEGANARLQQEVAERRRVEEDLRQALGRLEEHGRRTQQFVANVTHELKTPLTSMDYAVENLLRGIVGPIPEKARDYLLMLHDDCRRLTTTVNDILDVSRAEADTLALRRVVLSFSRFVHKSAEALRLQAQAHGHTLTVTLHEDKRFVSCDPDKMGRAVLNLIQNAINYTPPGGCLEVLLEPSADGGLTLRVVDNGVGIAPEHLGHVTERFYRVGEQVAGCGLGLALCKEVVALHGGSLVLTSPPPGRDQGTQVALSLPCVDPPRVLAADDDEVCRRLLETELRQQGYRVTTCEDGLALLRTIQEQPPELLIVDLIMPGLDGIGVIAAVKAAHEWRRIPIVVVTGGELDRTKREILAGFAIPPLVKPWKTEELLQRVEDAMLGFRLF